MTVSKPAAANGVAAPAKPAGGVKVLRSFAQAATAPAVKEVTGHLNDLSVNGSDAPPALSPSEQWDQLVSTWGGEEAPAAVALRKQLLAGKKAAAAIGGLAKTAGLAGLQRYGLIEALQTAMVSEKTREGALAACAALAKEGGKPVEPYLLPMLPQILESFADSKLKTVAEAAGSALVEGINPHATCAAVGPLLAALASNNKWQIRVGALGLLAALAQRCPEQLAHTMLRAVPILSECMVDSRSEVSAAATSCMLACCQTAGNRDLEPHTAVLVSCIARPAEVADVIAKLSATTFVQAMEDACLAVMVPLMVRALRERSTTVKRRASVIIGNMCKLLRDPSDAKPFLPLLIPGLRKVADEAADPELREVAGATHDALVKVKEAGEQQEAEAGVAAEPPEVLAALREASATAAPEADLSAALAAAALEHVAWLGSSLITAKLHSARPWESCVVPYLEPHMGSKEAAAGAAHALQKWAIKHMGEPPVEEEDDEEDGVELCNCEFSLAYGGRILLSNTGLRLKRGKRYGLCGANGAGKSTLMKAIAGGKVDGFPPPDELRTVYVAHDIDASDEDTPVVQFVFQDKAVQAATAPTRDQVEEALSSVGFSDELLASPINSLSGGWKMKLALARAMLMRADILLLDEPTNHLDTKNVAWLQNYLVSRPDISSMIVSHDSGFLDTVCTDIIHYESRKLVHYKGNLSEFVKVKPEAKSYYELAATTTKFKFPDPGFLDGIKGKTQAILKLTGVSFTYPGASKPQLTEVNVRASLGSRVAVLGVNGAGKSTMIRMMTGEAEADKGTVWRHPNLRLAYVAQHAFHHVEQHLDLPPEKYFWWRFESGDDREALEKATIKWTDEEAAQRKIAIERGDRVIDFLNSRRMARKEYEYEVQWVGFTSKYNTWMPRTQLANMGYTKLCNELDTRLANFRNYRAVSTPAVLAHLADFGLPEDVASHTAIRGLSGGQKVKLVLAAAMWCSPHMLVLDEPTNYLDRESLGALAEGIREFAGAVVMISHNSEFTSALCNEEWYVANGKVTCTRKGGAGASTPPRGMSTVPSMASMATVSSVASLASMASVGNDSGDEDGEELDEEKLLEKQAKREEKVRAAAEKQAKRELAKKLKFSKRH